MEDREVEVLKIAKEFGYNGMFACPEDVADLTGRVDDLIKTLSAVDRVAVVTMLSMTINIYSKMIAEGVMALDSMTEIKNDVAKVLETVKGAM